MYSKNDILSPFTLPNGAQLKNRLLMAPMTTCTGNDHLYRIFRR